jgi:hypothetical protein
MPYYCFVMRRKSNKWIIYNCLIIFFVLQSCTYHHLPESNKVIVLRWYPAPANQSKEEFMVGVSWLLSYLGAKLPLNTYEQGVKFIETQKVELNIDALGFSSNAEQYLQELIAFVKLTEEYKVTGGIDAGRFFALCFNSTYQYYKITEAPLTYDNFTKKYASFVYKTFVCDTSSISNYSRIFNYTIGELTLQNNYFVSQEGVGRYSSGSFVKNDLLEVFDYMENGQPRFMIYNQKGNLYVPDQATKHPAGKPAKCMWCHESGMQPLFNNTPSIMGYVSKEEFSNDQILFTKKLNDFHRQTNAKIDFSDKKAHTQGEFIYLCFYEPNAQRLAMEWNITLDQVAQILSGVPTHTNPEFPFLKNVYHRYQIATYAPYQSIEVAHEMREASAQEPNYLK